MKRLFLVLSLPLLLLGGGCASVASGTTQDLTFDSVPQGAECTMVREGELISKFTTPTTIEVSRDKDDLHIVCKKEGYHDASNVIDSEIEATTVGNVLLGGLVGWAVDSATGADNHYDEHLTVTLVELPGQKEQMEQPATPPMADADKGMAPKPGTFGVSLATYRDPEVAEQSWGNYVRTYPELKMASAQVTPSQGAGGDTLYSLRGTGLSEEAADEVCAAMEKNGDYCRTVQF